MYSKLALVSIDEHKYAKGKYSETSAQAALSSKEPLLHTPVPTDQLSNSNWTQGHLSYADRNHFTLFQRQPGFFCLLHFRENIKGKGCLKSLVIITSSVSCPQCWIYTRRMKTTHLFLAAPYLPVWHFLWPELSAHTSLTFGVAQAAGGSLHLPPCFIHIYCTRTNAFYKKML